MCVAAPEDGRPPINTRSAFDSWSGRVRSQWASWGQPANVFGAVSRRPSGNPAGLRRHTEKRKNPAGKHGPRYLRARQLAVHSVGMHVDISLAQTSTRRQYVNGGVRPSPGAATPRNVCGARRIQRARQCERGCGRGRPHSGKRVPPPSRVATEPDVATVKTGCQPRHAAFSL